MINEEKRKLQLYEAKFQELQEREKSTMKILEKAQAKSTKLNQIASDAISKVRSFVEHPLVDDLLWLYESPGGQVYLMNLSLSSSSVLNSFLLYVWLFVIIARDGS